MIADLCTLILIIGGVALLLMATVPIVAIGRWTKEAWRRVNLGAYRADRRLWEK